MVAANVKSKKSKKSKAQKDKAPAKAARALAPIETLAAATAAPRYLRVPMAEIVVDEAPNRLHAPTAETVEDLARSMAQVGLKQPIGVTLYTTSPNYRLVWGRRRLEAARRLGWTDIETVLVDVKSEQELLVLRGIENMQRQEVTPVDEAMIVAHVLDVYEAQAALGPTAEPPQGEQPNLPLPIAQQVEARRLAVRKAAEWFGKPEAWIRDRMYLSRFGPRERELVATGRLTLLHAREISKLADPEARAKLAHDAAAGPRPQPKQYSDAWYDWREFPMKLEELQELVSSSLLSLAQVPWTLDTAFGGKPACVECPHNSANNPGLFEGGARFAAAPADRSGRHVEDHQTKEPKAGVCTNRACYAIKSGLAKRAVRTTANRANKAIKELPKKERPAKLTPYQLSTIVEVPDFIDRAQVVTMAEQLAKPASGGAGGAGGKPTIDPGVAARNKEAEQRREAGYKLDAARRGWCKKTEPLLAKALMETPGAWSVYKIFRQHPAVRKLEGHNVNGEKVMAGPEFRQALQLLTAPPSLETIAALEKGCGRKFGLLDEWSDVSSGLAAKILEAFGIEADPAPKLEDFLPKPKAAAKEPDDGKVSHSMALGDVAVGDLQRLLKMSSAAKLEKNQASIVTISGTDFVVGAYVCRGDKVLSVELIEATPADAFKGKTSTHAQLLDAWDAGSMGRGNHAGHLVKCGKASYVLGDTWQLTPSEVEDEVDLKRMSFEADPRPDDGTRGGAA